MKVSDHNSPRGNVLERAPRCLAALALAVGLVVWGVSVLGRSGGDAYAQAPTPVRAAESAGLMVLPLASDAAGPHPLVVIDAHSRVMSVYHVDRATGELSLKSVRSVQWDLRLEEFNSALPTPREIRSLVERR